MKPILLCYHKCSTCVKTIKWLNENNIEFENRAIVDDNPTADELREWIAKSGLPIRRFFNTSGIKYREMGLKDVVANGDDESLIKLLATDGMLVKRPLLVTNEAVFPGFREAEYAKILL